MHIVAIAWIFVVVLMAAAEATSSQGTVLGAVMTLLLYGALPLWIVMYLLGTPMRRKARRAAEDEADARAPAGEPGAAAPGPASGLQGDGRGQTPGDGFTPEREKP